MKEELIFPVTAHHRIIVNAAERDDAKTKELFEGFDLVEPVEAGNVSAGGRYLSYSLSVRLGSREEMEVFDNRIALVPGLQMAL